jgi:enoyl-CoA hydratase
LTVLTRSPTVRDSFDASYLLADGSTNPALTPAMTADPVTYDAREGVARITLNRPAVLNALDSDLALALADHAAVAAADPDVTLVVVRGAGRAFCSGMDRTALAEGRIGEAFYRHWIRALNTLEDMPKIALAVLHGYAIGGGLQLALACDLRLATDDAVIGLGATRHGLIPDGAVLRLARVVGLGRAKELALLNDTVTPAEARSLGLVNWVCRAADVDATLETLLAKSRGAAPTAVAHTKRLLQESFHADPRSMIEALVEAQRDCMTSWEIDEANRAWREQREAVFSPPPRHRKDSPPA